MENISKKFNKLLIIDGSFALHRSLHVQSMFDMKNSKGDRTGGVFGFLKTLNSELKKNMDCYPVVCFDDGLASRRVKADPYYKKANERDNDDKVLTPEECDIDYVTQYRIQRNKLIDILSYFGIPSLKFVGWEGDDLIYILSKASEKSVVITDDKDMLQLLSENCSVRRPMKEENWDVKSFVEAKGLSDICDFIIFKSVLGDPSDNIPSCCKGIGEASIVEFIKLINCFKISSTVWNFDNYPQTESDMKSFCSDKGIKYKKAYLNFDKQRFYVNMELVDLNRVEVPDEIMESIVATVSNCKGMTNYFNAIKILSELEIRDIDVSELMMRVSTRDKNILLE